MNEKIKQLIFDVIDEFNAQASDDQQLEKNLDAALYGGKGKLDSLGLVNVMVYTEQKIKDEMGVLVAVANEKAMSLENSPFKTVGSLVEYVESLIREKQEI